MADLSALRSLAVEINQAHEATCRAVRSGLESARRAGELLIEAKAGIEHGAWLPWLAEHCPTISERTAQAYMRVAREWPALEAKAQRVADLPFRQAVALLAESSDEPAADPSELSDLESAIAKVDDDVDDMLWEQARQVVAVLDAGLKERQLACLWINGRTGKPYGRRHVRVVREIVRDYLDSHPRPRFRDRLTVFNSAVVLFFE